MKKLAAILISCGVALLIYGLLNFQPSNSGFSILSDHRVSTGYSYGLSARIEAAAGAVLTVLGVFIRTPKNPT